MLLDKSLPKHTKPLETEQKRKSLAYRTVSTLVRHQKRILLGRKIVELEEKKEKEESS